MVMGSMETAKIESSMFTELVEQSSDVILVTDKDFSVKYANRSVTRILGLAKAEVIGKSIFNFINAEKEFVLREFLEASLSNNRGAGFTEVCIPCRHKGSIHFDVSIANLFDDPAVDGLVITLHDITKRKSIEEKLLKANTELDHFMYKTSHDLRAPLLTSLGLIDLAQRDTESSKYEYLEMIEKNMRKLDAFIEDINSFYRNERLIISREVIDMKMAIENELKSLSDLYDVSTVDIDISSNRIADFYSDGQRVRAIINNVLSNAIKYRSHERRSKIKIDVHVMPDSCQIIFRDNGIGIREQYLERIFEIFYRADENAKGSGLGLYITKNMIQKLGGTVTVSSIYGEGSTFIINLPNLTEARLSAQELQIN